MSVLINMEMPTSCRACHLKMNCDDCEGYKCVCVPLHQQIGYLDDLLADKRRDDCPLVPVPPHGDLIDRQALLKLIENPDDDGRFGYLDALDITCAPTIIPADKEVDNG